MWHVLVVHNYYDLILICITSCQQPLIHLNFFVHELHVSQWACTCMYMGMYMYIYMYMYYDVLGWSTYWIHVALNQSIVHVISNVHVHVCLSKFLKYFYCVYCCKGHMTLRLLLVAPRVDLAIIYSWWHLQLFILKSVKSIIFFTILQSFITVRWENFETQKFHEWAINISWFSGKNTLA